MRSLKLICLIILLLISTDAYAVSVYKAKDRQLIVDFENVLNIEWHNNHELEQNIKLIPDDYTKISDQLLARVRFGEFSFGLEIEGLYYPEHLDERLSLSPPNTVDPQIKTTRISDSEFYLNRYYFTYNSRVLKVDFGDYYVTLGRGLALSIRKEGENDINNTLRGGKIEIRYKNTRITGLSGFSNVNNVDPNHELPQKDPFDLISAFRLEQRLANYFSLGAHFVNARFGALESDNRKRFIADKETFITGGTVEFPNIADHLSLYFEGNYMYRTGRKVNSTVDGFDEVNDGGFGLYGSLSFYIQNFTFTGEYKQYNDFLFRRARTKIDYIMADGELEPLGLDFFEDIYYNTVPNLERKDIETNRDYGNDQGMKVNLEYNFEKTGTTPYLAGYFTLNQHSTGSTSLGGLGGESNAKRDRIWHIYGGITQRIRDYEVFVDGGFRDEYSRENKKKILDLIHVKTGATLPIVSEHTLTFEAFFQRKNHEQQFENEYVLDLTLGYAWSRYLSLSLLYTLQKKDYDAGVADDTTEHFVAGEIRSTPLTWMDISIFAGQVRESQRCYGGFCRIVPKFEGVKGKIKIRF